MTAANRPIVRAAAIVSDSSIHRAAISMIALFSRRKLQVFDSRALVFGRHLIALLTDPVLLQQQRLDLIQLALSSENRGEVVERRDHIRMILTEQFLPHGQGFAEHCLGLSQIALPGEHQREVAK